MTQFEPREDAHVLTRKQWSQVVSEWQIPEGFPHLLFDHLEESDTDRIIEYCASSLRNQRGEESYMADTYGTWIEMQHRNADCQAVVRTMIEFSRGLAGHELYDIILDVSPVDKMGYANYMVSGLRLTANHVMNVASNLKQRVLSGKHGGILDVSAEDFDVRNERPVIPLAVGGALDLTTGKTLDHRETQDCMLRARGWALPMLDPAILESDTLGAATMRSAIENRFGHGLIDRIARHSLGISKSIDAIVAPANWGKSTLITLMERAFPGMVGRVEAGRALTTAGDRWSVVTSMLSKNLWVFIDEAGGKTGKTIHESILKTWVDDNVSVEEKFEKRVGKRRMGTAIFIGYDYPHIDMSQQGMQERFRWAYEGQGGQMDEEERRLLLSEDGVALFRQSVMRRAVQLWQTGDPDAETMTSESWECVNQFIDKRQNPIVGALLDAFELGEPRDFVPTELIKSVIEIELDGEEVTGTMVRDMMAIAFHGANIVSGKVYVTDEKTEKRKQVRAWKGLRTKTVE